MMKIKAPFRVSLIQQFPLNLVGHLFAVWIEIPAKVNGAPAWAGTIGYIDKKVGKAVLR